MLLTVAESVRRRSAPALDQVGVLVLAIAGLVLVSLAAGAHEYVIKPFTPETITAKLRLLGLAGTPQ